VANEQRWFLYVKDNELERYISILEGMIERNSYGSEYMEKLHASLARLEAEYERRAS
jgi:hypothetical protein